jgi:hypothetical protein
LRKSSAPLAARRISRLSPTPGTLGRGIFIQTGGSGAAAPTTAGIFNKLGLFYSSSRAALTAIYANTGGVRTKFVTDINSGLCGPPGYLIPGGYERGLGQPYDPSFIEATTGISCDWFSGWGTMHGTK